MTDEDSVLAVVFVLEFIQTEYSGVLNGHQNVFLDESIRDRRKAFGPGQPSPAAQAKLLDELAAALSRDSVNGLSKLLDAIAGRRIERHEDRETIH